VEGREHLGEERWFSKAIDKAVVTLHVLEETNIFHVENVKELFLLKTGINISQPVNIDNIFTTLTIEIGILLL
jgi:hypothetical protein